MLTGINFLKPEKDLRYCATGGVTYLFLHIRSGVKRTTVTGS
jgi:hypothetical protein